MRYNKGKRLVHGVGINDANYQVKVRVETQQGKEKIVVCPYYQTWKNMLMRVYSSSFQTHHQSYKGVKVCEEWLTFSNFKRWMEKQDWEGKSLDKDLLGNGKFYSPETCCFLEPRINTFLVDGGSGILPHGVTFHKGKNKYMAQCNISRNRKPKYLGYYDDTNLAHLAWKSCKNNLAQKYAEEVDDPRIKEALRTRYL